jgi:hypothetical protein
MSYWLQALENLVSELSLLHIVVRGVPSGTWTKNDGKMASNLLGCQGRNDKFK